MKATDKQFIMGLNLIKHMDAIRGSYIVADVILRHMSELYAPDYHFFDVTNEGTIVASRGTNTVTLKIGKWARSVLHHNVVSSRYGVSLIDTYGIKESDIEKFQNHMKGRLQLHSYSFEILGSSAIPDIMVIDRENTGRLGDSCMNGQPDKFKMLAGINDLSCLIVTSSDGTLIARSFIWDAEVGGGKVKFMDRFYTSKDYLDGVLCDYAFQNGFWRKRWYDTYEHKTIWVSPEKKSVNVVATVSVKNQTFSKYPYLDTFCFGGDGLLSNSHKGCKYMYNSVFGMRETKRELTGAELDERDLILNGSGIAPQLIGLSTI